MERISIKNHFDNMPKCFYPTVRKQIYQKMKITNQTFYNWVNGKTNPTVRDYESLCTIIYSVCGYDNVLFKQ